MRVWEGTKDYLYCLDAVYGRWDFPQLLNRAKDLWEKWLSQNKDSMIVKNGLIFAHSDQASVEAEGREKEACKSGLERLDPNKLPSTSRRITTARGM